MARRACETRFLASLSSLALRFQPRSRPFVWLLVRRKVTRGWKIPPRLASPCGTTILPGARVFRSLNYPGQGKWGATRNSYSRYVTGSSYSRKLFRRLCFLCWCCYFPSTDMVYTEFLFLGGGEQGLFKDFFFLYFDIKWHEVKIFQIRTSKGVYLLQCLPPGRHGS